jgi:hypothetical protein
MHLMPVRKKTVPENGTAAAETTPKTTVRRAPAKKTGVAAGEPAPARRRSTAATHKPNARAAAAGAEAAPGFDPVRHAAEIQREAYFQWLNRGRQHGGDAADWFHAEQAVKARYSR